MRECKSTGKNAGNSDYICNPETGIWVKKDGPTGKKILGGQLPLKQVKPVGKLQECKSSAKNANNSAYICNPQTGVWVKKNGPTGRKILNSGQQVKSPKKLSPIRSKKNCNPNGKNAKSPDYICNNETGLWVKKDGPTGRRILGSKRSPSPMPKSIKSIKSIPMHEKCKLTNVDEPITNVYYYKYPLGVVNSRISTYDIIGIFTSKSYAQSVCKCANTNFNKHGWILSKPYTVLDYILNSDIKTLDTYILNIRQKDEQTVYIVYGMLKSIKPKANYVSKNIRCVGYYTVKHLFVDGKKTPVQNFRYKLNTLFATNVLTDYKLNKTHVPKSIYHDQMYKIPVNIPFLDNNGIKYDVWDNVDNIKGTCVWHVISKAMNMPIPKIAEKIKNMSTQVSPRMIGSNPNTTNLDVYNKLMKYEEKQFAVYPRYLCYVPKFAKEYAVVTFFVSQSDKKYITKSPIVQCVSPHTKPTKVIFTCSIKSADGLSGHHVLVTIKGVKGWSFNVQDVQHVLNVLPSDCKSKLS